MNDFKTQALQELTDQQVRFAPPARRLQNISQAERLLSEIDLAKEYPYQWVCYRVTDFRPDAYADLLILGQDLMADLCLMIAELAGSIPAMPVEELAEPVLTLDQISKKLNVTTKTINRWRKRGLIGLPVIVDGRRHVGFLPSMVDPFLLANQRRVERGAQFTQLTQEEKEEIVVQAQQQARQGAGNLTQISRQIAEQLGRSAETVRYTLKNYDREHPGQALFPQRTGPLDPATKQLIFSSFRKGISVDTLANRFARTRSSMYRVINEMRAQKFLEHPVECIFNEAFADPAQEAAMLAEMPGADDFDDHKRQLRVPKDAPPELASLYEVPLLNKDQEQHLFRKMNFLKYKVARLLEDMKLPSGRIDTHSVRTQDLDQVQEFLDQANLIKDQLVSCNMRLVVSIAKKHSGQTDNFFELLSDGNMSLLRAVEKFDYARGNKFSTYASWAIIKNYARSIPEEGRRKERYQTGNEDLFEVAQDNRTDEHEWVASAEQASNRVNRLLEYLDPRERDIIRMRAGLDSENMTLEKIGEKLGITKERVRQLNVRAMKKLRGLVEQSREEL